MLHTQSHDRTSGGLTGSALLDDAEFCSTTACRGGVTPRASEVPAMGEGMSGPPGVPTGGQAKALSGALTADAKPVSATRPKSHGQMVGVLTVEGIRGEGRLLCSIEQPAAGWKVITAVVDSGAEETVAPPGLLPGRVETSPMQRAGGRYRAANGARIPNLGQQLSSFRTPEGHGCSLRFQLAGVERPLISASQLLMAGPGFAARISLSSDRDSCRCARVSRARIRVPWAMRMAGSSFATHCSLSGDGAGCRC